MYSLSVLWPQVVQRHACACLQNLANDMAFAKLIIKYELEREVCAAPHRLLSSTPYQLLPRATSSNSRHPLYSLCPPASSRVFPRLPASSRTLPACYPRVLFPQLERLVSESGDQLVEESCAGALSNTVEAMQVRRLDFARSHASAAHAVC